MGNELEEKIYKYGDSYYSFKEMYEIYNRTFPTKKKQFKDCIAHYILSEIFRKCDLVKEANNIEAIADIEKNNLNIKPSKMSRFINEKEYLLRVKFLFGISGLINKYKVSEFVNGEWLLERLVSLTIGSSYEKNEYDEFSLIDYNSLSKDECMAIIDNYKRNIRGEEIVFYRAAKTLENLILVF